MGGEDNLGLDTPPCPPPLATPQQRGAYPGAGSRQCLPKGLKVHLLVVAHQLSQGAVTAGVPRDEVAPVLELVDDEMPTAVTAPTTQVRVPWVLGAGQGSGDAVCGGSALEVGSLAFEELSPVGAVQSSEQGGGLQIPGPWGPRPAPVRPGAPSWARDLRPYRLSKHPTRRCVENQIQCRGIHGEQNTTSSPKTGPTLHEHHSSP